jgi:hypothetical protein
MHTKKLNRAVVDSHAYFFFFLPVLPPDFFFFLPFLLLSHFILSADRECGSGRGSVSPGHPLRVNLPLLGFRFNPKTIFVALGTIFVTLGTIFVTLETIFVALGTTFVALETIFGH